MPPGPPVRDTMEQALVPLLARLGELGAALRVLRQLVIERLVVLEAECHRLAGRAFRVSTLLQTYLAIFAVAMMAALSPTALGARAKGTPSLRR